MDKISDIETAVLLAAGRIIGMDLAIWPDRTSRWPTTRKPKVPDPQKRAKVKAARKQRNRP